MGHTRRPSQAHPDRDRDLFWGKMFKISKDSIGNLMYFGKGWGRGGD